MSDPLDVALRGLRGQRPPAPFAPPEAVRRRGRQRSTHQVMAAGVAVLAVIGGSAGWLSAYGKSAAPDFNPPGATTPPPSSAAPTPSGSGHPSSSPSRGPSGTQSPFLTLADLGSGSWRPMTGGEPFESGKSIWSPDRCPDDPARKHPTLNGIVDFNAVSYTDDAQRRVTHAVERYAPGTGAARVAEIRAQLQRCSRTTKWPNGTAPTRYTVTPLSGVGDEAFLVKSEAYGYVGDTQQISREPMLVALDAVVRVGDRIASITTYNTTTSTMDEAFVRTLIARAAERLR